MGVDHPLPKGHDCMNLNQPMLLLNVPLKPIGLEPGSKLALRFPHLVKGASPTKGGGAGGQVV